MAARRLPSFHDAYVQVLAQLDTLKRVHAMQLATTEGQSSQSRSREVVRAEAGEEGEAIGNGGSMPTVEHDEIRLVVEMNEKKCVDDERSVHAKEGGGGGGGGKKEDRKRGRHHRNFHSDGDVAESNYSPAAVERTRTGTGAGGHNKKKKARNGGIVQNFEEEEQNNNNNNNNKNNNNEEEEEEEEMMCQQPSESNCVLENSRDEAVMTMANGHVVARGELLKKHGGRLLQETREQVYEEMRNLLAEYVKLDDLNLSSSGEKKNDSFPMQLRNPIRLLVDLLHSEKMNALNLKEAVLEKEEENRTLVQENEELHKKLHSLMSSSPPHHEILCNNCKGSVRTTRSMNDLTPMPADNHFITEVTPDAGEEVAAEVIRSLAMTHNHRSTASTSVAGMSRLASEDAAGPLLELQCNKVGLPSAKRQDSDAGAAATTPSSSSKRKGNAISGGVNGKHMSDKTKRLLEIGRDLAKRAGVTLRAESDQLPQVKRLICKNDGGDELSESDTESVIKRVVGQDARPWVNGEAGARNFLNTLESITEWSPEEQPLIEQKIRDQSLMELSEALRSERFMGLREAIPDGVVEDSVDANETHFKEEKKPEDEGDDKRKSGTKAYKEYDCGVTTKTGDTTGILRVYESGVFQVFCQCTEVTCTKGVALTPWDFERHGGRGSSKKWRDSIWVKQGTQRVPVSRVKELDTYIHSNNSRRDGKKLRINATEVGEGSKTHRDEFVTCSICLKQRRFRRRNPEECRTYHDAANNPHWECANFPDNKYPNCEEEEEREVRRAQRGCVHSRYCLGCVHCVCLGCTVCRFNECECPSCVEFLSRSASREPGREVATQTSLTKALNSPLSLPVPACKDR